MIITVNAQEVMLKMPGNPKFFKDFFAFFVNLF